MKITKYSIKKPITVVILLLLIVLGSIYSLINIPIEVLPSINISMITIQTIYPTATPFEVEKYVSIPIEDALAGIDGVTDITTTSIENASVVALSFDYDVDIDKQIEVVNQRIDSVVSSLPSGAEQPTISSFQVSSDSVISFSVASDTYDRDQLTTIIDAQIMPQLQKVSGVASIETLGTTSDYIRVELDDTKLAKYGLSAATVIQLVGALQTNIPIGTTENSNGQSIIIKGQATIEDLDDLNNLILYEQDLKLTDLAYVTKDDATTSVTVRFADGLLADNGYDFTTIVQQTKNELASSGITEMMYDLTSDATTESFTITSPYLYTVLYNQLANKVVKENAQLKLSDIASISIKKKAFEAIAHYDNEETIVLNVYKTSGTNTNKLVKEVEDKMADISISNVKIDAFNNQGSFITDSIMSVLDSLLIGGALAIIILLLFLHNIKGSVMVAISIPLSLLMTIDLMYIFNVPLNVISLGGMAVATGMVVDAAIVITERLYYYHSIEDDAGLVSVKATKSVGGAVLASTITTIAVFLPITFTEGFTKSVFEQIAYVVTFALIASCLVAFTIVPLLFKVFYQNKDEEEKYKTRKISDVFTAFASKFAKKFLAIYHSIISFVVRFHKSVLFLSVAGMAVIFVFLIPKIGFEFLPETDQSKVTINLTMPSGTSLTETEKTVKIIENRLSGMEEIEHVYVTIGDKEFAVSDTYSSNLASFTINVTPATERSTSLSDIANEMKTRLSGIECESLLIEQVDNFGSDITGGSWSDYLADVAIQVQCENRNDLDDYVNAVTKVLEDRGDLTNIKTDLGVGAQEARLTYDYEKITKMGLSSELNPAAVSQSLYAAVDGTKLMSITYNEESYELVIGYQESQVQSVSDILDLVVYSYDDDNDALTPNKYIYLKDIASVQYVTGYSTLTRINNYSAATVYARITSDMTSGKMNQALEKSINDLNFPDSVKIVYKGSNHFMNEAFSGLLVALCISVVLVYAVMAIQFQSFKVPLIIMLSLPMGFTGSIVLCYFLGYSLNVCSFIGMIMLVGVVVNNAIVLLDRVKQMRDEGQKRQDAIINSSCERLRPILMTSLTTIFGLLPLIFTISSGIGTLLASLSAVVAGGMVTSTLLTLIVIPSAYETFSHYDENKYSRKIQNNN